MSRTSPPLGAVGRLPGTADDAALDPAWYPWLELLEIAHDAAGDAAWAEVSLSRVDRSPDAPLLDGATVRLDSRRAGELLQRLSDTAGIPRASELSPGAMIRAAIARDERELERVAERIAAPAGTVAVLAQMAAIPVLHAAARHLGTHAARTWQRGYCPVCGAWPSLIEMRGIERERRLRCGCCSADWPLPVLRCAFCGETDHHQLGSLVPESAEQYRRIETCERCHGYLKVVTTLGALPLRVLARQDLVTVPLDLAAQDRGYNRPARPGWALATEVAA